MDGTAQSMDPRVACCTIPVFACSFGRKVVLAIETNQHTYTHVIGTLSFFSEVCEVVTARQV